MILNKLLLKSFGKFQNREIVLKEGINVVYGENESGKSTMHTFLRAMFFGLRRMRGKASRTDTYTRYKPWGENTRYEGILWFTCGEKRFRLERDFSVPQSPARLFCETDGELLSVADGDLDMLLGNISETVFQNTVFVPQAKSRTEEGLYTELRDYLADFQGTGDMRFDLESAEEILKNRKKLWEQQEKEEQKRKEQAETKIRYQIQHEQSEIENLREQLKSLEESSSRLEKQRAKLERAVREAEQQKNVHGKSEQKQQRYQTEWRKNRGFQIVWKIWTILLVVIAMLGIGNRISLVVMTFLLGILLIAGAGFWIYEKKQNSGETEAKETEDMQGHTVQVYPSKQTEVCYREWKAVSEQCTRIRERQKVLLENHQERVLRLENLEAEYQELRQDNEALLRIRKEIRSVLLALQKLREAAKRMQGLTGGILTQKMSEAVSGITGGAYRQVVLDGNFQIYLDTGETCLDLPKVSYGTAEQVYLALRMACREILCREEELPLILDETFAMYDHKRLLETLQYVNRRNSQVILFSCNRREIEALKELGIPFHCIEL